MENIIEQIKDKIMQEVEDHKIRLTPKEYKELINNYLNRYVFNIDISSLIELSNNINKRNN